MQSARRFPPAYAARWQAWRRRPANAHNARRLDVHLGWDGKTWAAVTPSAVWLPPDRDPERTDWRCARGTCPFIYAHDAPPDNVLATAHAILAAGCELVVIYHGARRLIYTNFPQQARP